MPSKKKKYNSRFPPARIKKIMQSDEEVGKVAQVVPIIISKSLEIFVASLLKSSSDITRSRNARTLTPNHIKQSILSSNQFNFLRDLAQTIPDVNPGAEGEDDDVTANPVGVSAGGQPMAAHSFHRKLSENRTTIATTSSGHQLSAAGQTAAISFRGRGRPRKRLIPESQSSIRSMTSTEEPDDDEETEEEEDDEEDQEDDDDINSDNNNRNNVNNQQNNNNNNFNVINANYYYSTTQPSNPSPFVSTIQSMASSSAAGLKSNHIDEDDDYDN